MSTELTKEEIDELIVSLSVRSANLQKEVDRLTAENQALTTALDESQRRARRWEQLAFDFVMGVKEDPIINSQLELFK